MPRRLKDKLLLRPDDFSPTEEGFRVLGVFNPGVARMGDEVVLLVRVAEGYAEEEEGWLYSPRFRQKGERLGLEVERLQIDGAEGGRDHRKPLLVNGRRRLAFASHLELVSIAEDGHTVKEIVRHDDLYGRTGREEFGVEDARITKIGDTYYVTYVSVSSTTGICTSLMATKDFDRFERLGIIFPCENKDVVLFPERVGGKYWAFHRPVGKVPMSALAIMAANSPDLLRWGEHQLVLASAADPGWYATRIGAGTPPIRTPEGWLSIFHGVRQRSPDDVIGEYTAGAMLTALDQPDRLIGLSKEPFLRPEAEHERKGYVGNVVFPTGMVTDLEDPDKLHVYYGCADSCIAVATFSVAEILGSLTG